MFRFSVFPLKDVGSHRPWIHLISATCSDSAAWGSQPPASVDPSAEETCPWPCPLSGHWRSRGASSGRPLSPPPWSDSAVSAEVAEEAPSAAGCGPPEDEPRTDRTSTAAAAGGCGLCCAGSLAADCTQACWMGTPHSWCSVEGHGGWCQSCGCWQAQGCTAGCGAGKLVWSPERTGHVSNSCTVRCEVGRTAVSYCGYTGDRSKELSDCLWSLNQSPAAPESHRAVLRTAQGMTVGWSSPF